MTAIAASQMLRVKDLKKVITMPQAIKIGFSKAPIG